MLHKQFLKAIEDIYTGISNYDGFLLDNRAKVLINYLEEERDFRFLLPLFFMKDFNFDDFVNNNELSDPTRNIIHLVYYQTKIIVKKLLHSIESRNEFSMTHRARVPKINIKDVVFSKYIDRVEEVNFFKLKAEFFYEDKPDFNKVGPLYKSVKEKLTKSKIFNWSLLPIHERKLEGSRNVIEFYIFTKNFPPEGKLIKESTPKANHNFLKPSVKELRLALKDHNLHLLGYNICMYPQLPITIKKAYVNYIKTYYEELNSILKKCDKQYLTAWRLGNYSFTPEPKDQSNV